MQEEKEAPDTTKLPAVMRAQMLSNETSMFFNVALFEHGQRIAQMFAGSTMVPQQFRDNPGNCMIALNYASRIQADPFMMMQCMYVIGGNPGIEGKLVAALVNQSSKYSEPLEYQWIDANGKEVERHVVFGNPAKDGRGCRAVSIDAKSGAEVVGPTITWNIVHAEGWFNKNGSKWKTMPELMFMYRAASWFANIHCPEVKLGMQTTEELRDIVTLGKGPGGTYSAEGVTGADLKDLLQKTESPYAAGEKADPADTPKPSPDKEPEPEKKAAVPKEELPSFDTLAKKYVLKYQDTGKADEELADFVDFCSGEQGIPSTNIMHKAAKDFDNFIKRFEYWLKEKYKAKAAAAAAQEQESQEQETKADNPFIPKDKWWSMRTGNFAKGTGFKAFCMVNSKWYSELTDIMQE
ncbi:MAG TPA: hypothetical protein VMW44_00500, partial [Candidatus Bathyarchaeia archaeon]|nr:hypothetical protein [Candidatus Bathyarchaeia archaeon]